jgi:hypothetical protein
MPENVTTLTDRWISATGADGADTRVRTRYLREAGVLPTQPRGRHVIPSIEAIHTTTFLSGCLVAGPQLSVVSATKKLFALRRQRGTEVGTPYLPDWMSFGQCLLLFIEMATTPEKRGELVKHLRFVNVTQGGGYAAIVYANGNNVEFFAEDLPYTNHRAPFATVTSAPPEVFIELSEVVIRSRRGAAEIGVSIEWQTAWRALGFESPATMQSLTPLIPLAPSGKASGNAPLKLKGGAGLPGRRTNAAHA